jgi:diguanylate cyclase (GGDEF)-like protein
MQVLIAEDDPVSRRILESTLKNWKYDVVSVSDGDEALKLLRSANPPRLALLDWMMPGKDGPQVCRELRAIPTGRFVYIVLVTARSDKYDIAAGLEAGADDYVVKPFEAVELKARLLAGTRIVELEDQLLAIQEKLSHRATHDDLTGVWNRAAILSKLETEIQRAGRQKTPLTVVMVDVDNFKAVNDIYGHQVGDVVLRNVAQTMANNLRVYDAVGRYGGEEFLIVAPGCDRAAADRLAQRLQTNVKTQSMAGSEREITITCSFGVVTPIDQEMTPERCIQLADEALYRAKAGGRDRVEIKP